MVLIGMTEISSCVFKTEIQVGKEVKKGEQLGHFQFGGSSGIIIIPANISTKTMWRGIKANQAFKTGEKMVNLPFKLPTSQQ